MLLDSSALWVTHQWHHQPQELARSPDSPQTSKSESASVPSRPKQASALTSGKRDCGLRTKGQAEGAQRTSGEPWGPWGRGGGSLGA